MISYQAAFHELREKLSKLYDKGEAAAIAGLFIDDLTSLSYSERLVSGDKPLTESQATAYVSGMGRLLAGVPVQHVIGYAWFMDKSFKVNEHVLIPRPETEELVQWIIEDWKEKGSVSILDIGTGSGCIPIMLKQFLPQANVTSCDISNEALKVAAKNAKEIGVDISLLHLDFLDNRVQQTLGQYDVIVSNPPYIPEAEKDTLEKNVRDYEPGTALFVPDNDALLFYKAIAEFGKTHLKKGGAIYCELHRDYAEQTRQMFLDKGYTNAELRKDIAGNDRMLKVWL